VIWIARVEYGGQPHIYDDNTYLFMAKIFASGQLSLPVPTTSTAFPGPFMVILNGRWFGQYEPGTALTLVPGVLLGVPWLVEPVLGTLALLGTGLIAARLYDRRVATLAVVLGCLSPFYSYLAASYLSHTIALFYLVWGLWALLRFVRGGAGWNMLICGLCFGMMALTRDLVALLFIVLLIPGVIWLSWQKDAWKHLRVQRLKWWLILVVIGLAFVYFYLGYNFLLTGDSLITPRSLFFSGDIWSFGQGVGFYGAHTLAAGFVNLDELLTSLQTDLFGWPFYLTLVFLAMPFLTRRAQKADWLLLIVFLVTTGSYVGYFYNGIYLGPRYLFEDLPFLLMLSARGILALGAWGLECGQATRVRLQKSAANSNATSMPGASPTGTTISAASSNRMTKPALSVVTLALVGALVLCNLFYYTPRQAVRYQNYTGLPDLIKLDTSQIYQSPLHHAIVVTDSLATYQQVLFALNDPALKGDVIYAWGSTMAQLDQLHRDFPGRALYLLVVHEDGSVHYFQVY
jgi:4-amino-4-deoxy-L-arabinose transferase-like glycosyltransferase